jgi:hypothetical protein
MLYKKGDVVPLKATIEEAADKGGIVVNIGGQRVALTDRALDAADQRPPSARPLTAEEEADAARERERLEMQRQAAAATAPKQPAPPAAPKPADKPAAAAPATPAAEKDKK